MVKRESHGHAPADSGSRGGRDGPCTASDDLFAGRAVPDADVGPLYRVLRNEMSMERNGSTTRTHLAAEGAGVSGMLGDLHPFYLLAQVGTVTLHRELSKVCADFFELDDAPCRTFR